MRCLALAQAWQDTGGQVCLAARLLPETLKRLWREEQIQTWHLEETCHDAGETVELAGEIGADWVVLDGYQFGTEFQRVIKNAGLRVLVVDDDGCARHYVADLILNPNPCAVREMYPSHDSSTALLLGPRHALLRREFLPARPANRTHAARARRVLVTLGGADPDNLPHHPRSHRLDRRANDYSGRRTEQPPRDGTRATGAPAWGTDHYPAKPT